MEIWKEIKGYEGLYQISNLGRVKRLSKIRWNRFAHIAYPESIITMAELAGYQRIPLTKNNKQKRYYVHRLIAQAFISNPENKPFVNHINGIKNDNRIENLEWCTQKENCIHAFKTKLRISNGTGKFNSLHHASKPVKQMDIEGNVIKIFPNSREIERQLGFAHTNIHSVCNKKPKYYTAYGYKWEYA